MAKNSSKDRAVLSLQEHRAIFNALKEGDPENAKDVMKAHIAKAKKHMLEGL